MTTKSEKYVFTRHSLYKIKYYGLSEQRVKRVIRHPARVEEAIILGMAAAMQPAGGKNYSEIWTIYQLVNRQASFNSQFPIYKQKVIKIITAWRYPGKSPIHNPIPREILDEIKSII